MESTALTQTCLWCYALTVASAVFPWINAEIIVLSLPAFASSKTALLILILVATAGQMTGKCVLYWTGRKGESVLARRRTGQILQKWRQRLDARPIRAILFVLLSALTGLPPFYVMSLVAGALKMNFLAFLAAGTAGRLVRFGALVTIPHLALSHFR